MWTRLGAGVELTHQDIAVELDKYSPPMDLDDLFAVSAPVEIEIGSGKGTFLLNQARQYQQINYLGIEWANKYYLYSIDRVRRGQLTNIKFLRADARDFIGRFVRDRAVTAFHVYFPDPWPKTRHHKRRFFAEENIHQVIRCLGDNGQLRIATDHAEYFEIICGIFQNPRITCHLKQIDFLPANSANTGEWVGTNFERKYIKQGRKIYTLALQKITAAK
jgi:tRNA (guanine-N7-)-methyltransferase